MAQTNTHIHIRATFGVYVEKYGPGRETTIPFFFYTTWVSILDFALFLDGELSQVTQDFGGTTDPHRWRFLAILKGQELGTRIVG